MKTKTEYVSFRFGMVRERGMRMLLSLSLLGHAALTHKIKKEGGRGLTLLIKNSNRQLIIN